MRSTAKPLRIPPEMVLYAENHEIFDLMQSMVKKLIVDKPEDPIQYLINLLKRDAIDVPRLILLGPPASGKRTIANELCEHIGAIGITAAGILEEDTDLTKQAKWYTDRQQEIPCELWIKLIQRRLSKVDCARQGWALEGMPRTRQEALCLQEAGISPSHVVMLEAPDEILIRRSWCKRAVAVSHDKAGGPADVLHVTCCSPEGNILSDDNTASRLIKYYHEANGLQRTFKNCLKIVKADQSHEDVFTQVLTFVQSRPRSLAPFTPRVLLLGPPGSGKRQQATLIAQKYNLVNICCGGLLKAVSADETSMGELIKPYLESREQVPDSMVLQVLTQTLSRLDCATRGWVLHGFPSSAAQAEMLKDSNFIPNRVFFLEMTDDAVKEVVTFRAIDPVTGERFHSLYKPAPSPEVQARLKQDPRNSEGQLLQRLHCYLSEVSALKAVFPDAVCVNADQDPHSVFEILESRLVERFPKRLFSAGDSGSEENDVKEREEYPV